MLKDNKLLNPIISALAAVYCLGAMFLAPTSKHGYTLTGMGYGLAI